MKICPVIVTMLFFASSAFAAETIPAPAAKAASKAEEAKGAKDETVIDHPGYRTTVVGEKDVRESDTFGTYKQPVWTATRRFTTTRVYVLPSGIATFEYWLTTSGAMEGDSQPAFESQVEVEIGLGRRLQLDLYLIFGQDGYAAPLGMTKEAIELRYAFADWGALWGNPTVYLEWIRQNAGPQKGEVKLLLGDQITPQWFWGFNLVFERELGGKTENEYAASAGISRVIIENRVSLGLEAKVALADEQGGRFDFVEKKLLVGPSLQLKPVRGVHIDLVPMAGALIEEETEPYYTIYFIIGKDL